MEALLKPAHLLEDRIIEALKSSGINKRRAEDELFQKYSYLIHITETKYFLGKDDLFDAYSDTILAVVQSISEGNFKNRSSLKTFVYEIYHNKCVDLIRKKSTRKNSIHKTESIDNIQAYLSDKSISIIEKLIAQSELQNIKQKMNYLSEKNKQVLLLSADGYSDSEIAVITQFKTADVVKTCRLRCLKKLRQML